MSIETRRDRFRDQGFFVADNLVEPAPVAGGRAAGEGSGRTLCLATGRQDSRDVTGEVATFLGPLAVVAAGVM